MAYEKQTWATGEVITQEKLNHMEDGIANAGGDAGYECSETVTELFSETITTSGIQNQASFSYSEIITADELIVTYDGVEYTCSRITLVEGSVYGYGGVTPSSMDYSQYPFAIIAQSNGNSINCETAGEHTVKVEAASTAVTTTPCFEKAVKSVIGGAEIIKLGTTEITMYQGRDYAQGTCSFEDGKYLSDILNGKKIIEYYGDFKYKNTGQFTKFILLEWLGVDINSGGDIRTMQSTGWAEHSANCAMTARGSESADADTTYNATIYAVCM